MEKVRSTIEDGIAVVTIASPPVNALDAGVRAGLAEAVRRADADPAVRAIVIAAEGRTFIAGADISEFGKPPAPPSLPEVIDGFDSVQKPLVAAIGGAALGGGLEVALGCHARIAGPGAKLGLPEVKLGLIPGAGGTQRLPRLIGAAPAFKLMADGAPASAAEALALGIVDAVVEGDLLDAAKAKALELAGTTRRTRDLDRQLQPGGREAFDQVAAEALKRSPDLPNIAALTESVRATFTETFEAGQALERARFVALVADDRSKALRYAFFAERETARVPGLAKDTARRPIHRAAVIGAGTMGAGIAMCFANAGIPVTVIETSEELLARGLDRIVQTYASSVQRGSLSAEDEAHRLSLVIGQVGLEAASDADLVVEAAFEDMDVKRQIFGTLDRVAKPGAILATNTSYLDVDAIAASTGRPADVVGLHFFSPANVMRLLEVVRGKATAPEVLATALDLGKRLGKVPVVVGVCRGFVGNRMLARRTQEAERLLIEGALPHEVDAALTGFGFRMGPFAVSDLAGLDIAWRNRKSLGQTAPVADALCEAGRLGQKVGRGYYLYPEGARSGVRDPEVEALLVEVSARLGVSRRAIPAEEIVERLVYPMVNEGARILEEGIAARPGDIDTIWLNGYGWPAWRGGPMFYADQVGLKTVAARLEAFAAARGEPALAPAPLLRRLADAGQGFA
ncbi:3-hydroxyacyl-CoA dehydrogenase NAD-binding domain-containing protein [Inquilinus sp.]|jgi:3-hydroxyacyl-CoA dehydrogenase|uniref:3-hydroxyacyl-CoA dehydrogenase NAD-binding domain-containing protein n=1 Tax=Inquilinus sp. TaxID=1932117 RepID=UPI003784D668